MTSSRRSRRAASSTGWSATRSARCCGRRSAAACRPAACSRSRVRLVVRARAARSRPSGPRSTGSIDGRLEAERPPPFDAALAQGRRQEGARARRRRKRRTAIVAKLAAGSRHGRRGDRARSGARIPRRPFITCTLQQEAARKLRLHRRSARWRSRSGSTRASSSASEGTVGLITYMRTDSTRVADDAHRPRCASTSASSYGAEYLPEEPNVYRSKKGAQDAHEAIRPTVDAARPSVVRSSYLDRTTSCKLYTLIWNRFVASQMTPAVYDQTTVDIERRRATCSARPARSLKFAGFTAVYDEARGRRAKRRRGRTSACCRRSRRARRSRCSSSSPSSTSRSRRRASREATARQGARGEGHRPAVDLRGDHVDDPVDREYVAKQEARASGRPSSASWSTDLLVGQLPRHPRRRASPPAWRTSSTTVEEGNASWVATAAPSFYRPFARRARERARARCATSSARRSRPSRRCEKCGKPMVIKWGRNGEFLACAGLPGVPQHDGGRSRTSTAPSRGRRSAADHRRELRDVRRADDDQARPLRRVPRVHELPRVQDDQADPLGVVCPECGRAS